MNRCRVLVVEDHPGVLQMMLAVLERAYDVATASDGSTALALLASQRFDAVLTDVCLPDASGFDLVHAAAGADPPPPVVMITAYANVSDAVAAIKMGAYDYLSKPLDADEISLVVARAIQRPPGDRHGAGQGSPSERVDAPEAGEVLLVGYRRAVEQARDRASRAYLVRLMRMYQGNVTHAAVRAGMTRESLHRVMKKYGVRSEEHR